MARWTDFARVAPILNGQQVDDVVWRFHLDGGQNGRKHTVFVAYELMKPDFEFLRITAAVSMLSLVDTDAMLRRVGQLQAGCISFTPSATESRPDNGMINLCTVIPLATLDLTNATPFLLYLNIFAMTADNIERELLPPGTPDMF